MASDNSEFLKASNDQPLIEHGQEYSEIGLIPAKNAGLDKQALPVSNNEMISSHAVDGQERQARPYNVDASPLKDYRSSRWRRGVIGAGFLAAAAAATYGVSSSQDEGPRVDYQVPYVREAQEAVVSVDDVLVDIGKVAFPAALGFIAITKLAGTHNARLRRADIESSREPSYDGRRRTTAARAALSAVVAGTVPVIASGAVGLAVFTESVSTEVGEGPSRPIEKLFGELPGNTLIVGYEGAMPMVQSSISRQLTQSVRTEAQRIGIPSATLDLHLGQITYGGENMPSLMAGVEQTSGSDLDWSSEEGCKDVPVAIDAAAGLSPGDSIGLNGMTATVTETIDGMSAMNRIGGVMDEEAMAACLSKDPKAPHHAIALETDVETARKLLASVNELDEPAAVMTEDQYKHNSEVFWEANVKPITNVLAVVSGGVALMSVSAIMGARLLRNRRELASKLAQGVSASYIRGTELLRAAKDGVAASVIGVSASAAATPLANALELGFRASVGYREIMVGFAVGVVGSVGGALSRLIRLRKAVNPSENTRI